MMAGMRRMALIGVLAAGVGAGVVPALAADQTVDATFDNKFTPATVTVNVGDTVTFRNAGPPYGRHNVHFADGPGNTGGFVGWTFMRRFDAPGRYEYVCEYHRELGMAGAVIVTGTGATPPSPPPVGATNPSPTPSARPQAPRFSVRPLRERFCARRGPRCPRPGIVLRVFVSERATVTGRLERRSAAGAWRSDGRVRFRAAAGRRTVTVARRTDGRRIGAGDYRLALRARAGSRPATAPRVVRVAVR